MTEEMKKDMNERRRAEIMAMTDERGQEGRRNGESDECNSVLWQPSANANALVHLCQVRYVLCKSEVYMQIPTLPQQDQLRDSAEKTKL